MQLFQFIISILTMRIYLAFEYIFVMVVFFGICSAHFETNETQMVNKNNESTKRKFHLREIKSKRYLIVEASSMLIKTVSSEDIEKYEKNQITWFTACNYSEICIAGIEEKSLYYDEVYGVFMFLTRKLKYETKLPMNIRLIPNKVDEPLNYASLFCSKGYLQLGQHFVGIGSETVFSVKEQK